MTLSNLAKINVSTLRLVTEKFIQIADKSNGFQKVCSLGTLKPYKSFLAAFSIINDVGNETIENTRVSMVLWGVPKPTGFLEFLYSSIKLIIWLNFSTF